MKPPTPKRRRLIVRIKPGGFLRIPLSFLYRSGWQTGDVLICDVASGAGGADSWSPALQTTDRDRLAYRTVAPTAESDRADDSPRFSPRNYALRRMSRSRPATHAMHTLRGQRG